MLHTAVFYSHLRAQASDATCSLPFRHPLLKLNEVGPFRTDLLFCLTAWPQRSVAFLCLIRSAPSLCGGVAFSSSIQTGAWSLLFSQPWGALSTSAAISRASALAFVRDEDSFPRRAGGEHCRAGLCGYHHSLELISGKNAQEAIYFPDPDQRFE